jgi:hypothetical protein
VSTLLFAVAGCAFDEAQGEELDEVAAADDRELATDDRELASEDDRELANVEEAPESVESAGPPGGPTTNVAYYDGCRRSTSTGRRTCGRSGSGAYRRA